MHVAVFADTLPASEPYSEKLESEIQKSLHGKGRNYRPRTQHLDSNGQPKYTNRLILEASPYLLQHAHNPVDWYSWGIEAFEKARRENKPVFLSIGYSTCHWCHVMEHESFDNIEIAAFMNRHFVSIKVDRERRPDVDMAYMTAVQLLNGSGGWPLNSFLTPDGKLFFGGTYYPPDRFLDLLKSIESKWRENRSLAIKQAEFINGEVQDYLSAGEKIAEIDRDISERALRQIYGRHDAFNGGFDNAPKFPNEPTLFLLFDSAVRYRDKTAMEIFLRSLRRMARGGIYDQVGGGFHRYSTDAHWLVPHFEKMLYNQANLSRLYIKAHEITGDLIYTRVAKQTLDYVLREMTSPDGGFYSATDADSNGVEGKYFVWTPEEVREVLTADEADFAIDIFGMTESGNFEGSNVLYLPVALNKYAEKLQLPLKDVINKVDMIREKLLSARNDRVAPLCDEKIVTAWNSMMIIALANAGHVLNHERYLNAAVRAAEYIWNKMRNEDNKLWRTSLNGINAVPASQEDYAYYSEALLALYDITDNKMWLKRAELIAGKMLEVFWDGRDHGFYMSEKTRGNPILLRPKDGHDSAIPSGNAIGLRVLSRLLKRTGNIIYQKYASETLSAFSSPLAENPMAYPYMLLSANEFLFRETGNIQYAARGKVRVKEASWDILGEDHLMLALSFNIEPGWHINSDVTFDKDLIPTRIYLENHNSAWKIDNIEYPEAIIKTLGFSKTRLSLFEDRFNVRLYLEENDDFNKKLLKTLPLVINIQACNNEICLPPEEIKLNVSTEQIQF